MSARLAEIGEGGLAQLEALVRCWLHQEPAEELGGLTEQAAQALWIERRIFRALGETISRVLGGK